MIRRAAARPPELAGAPTNQQLANAAKRFDPGPPVRQRTRGRACPRQNDSGGLRRSGDPTHDDRRSGKPAGHRARRVFGTHTLLLLHEYSSRAARDEAVAARYRERQASLREALAETLQARHEHTGVPLTFDANRLAQAFIALGQGLALDSIVDPDALDPALLGDILDLVYDGLIKRAESHL
jgi:hypothetical protein